LSLSDSDQANVVAKGLKPALREQFEGANFYSLHFVLVRGMTQELKLIKEKENMSLIGPTFIWTMRVNFIGLNLYGLLKINLFLLHHLSQLAKVSKKN
jgi:hypothetical protein